MNIAKAFMASTAIIFGPLLAIVFLGGFSIGHSIGMLNMIHILIAWAASTVMARQLIASPHSCSDKIYNTMYFALAFVLLASLLSTAVFFAGASLDEQQPIHTVLLIYFLLDALIGSAYVSYATHATVRFVK